MSRDYTIACVVSTLLTFADVSCQKNDLICHICFGDMGSACYVDGKSTQVLPCYVGTEAVTIAEQNNFHYVDYDQPLPEYFYCGYYKYTDFLDTTEVFRACFFAYRNICEFLTDKGTQNLYNDIDCRVCDTDYCNGTRTRKNNLELRLVILIATTIGMLVIKMKR